jgi:transketolase
MRHIFAEELYKLAKEDHKVIVIIGDVSCPWLEKIKADMPKQYLNIGIMEQTMVSFAAGMALMGFRPYVYTITPFLIERAFEQIKLDVDFNNLSVTLVGYSDYPESGPTHTENDAALTMCSFNNIKTHYPKDKTKLIKQMREAYEKGGPAFFGLKKYNGK